MIEEQEKEEERQAEEAQQRTIRRETNHTIQIEGFEGAAVPWTFQVVVSVGWS